MLRETGPLLEETLRAKLAEVEVRIQELTALRSQLGEALASVREVTERERRAERCEESICLPGQAKRG